MHTAQSLFVPTSASRISTFSPTQCIYVFCVVLRTNIISLYSINWMVFYNREGGVFTAWYGLNLRVMYINPSKLSGHCMYRQFNIQQFYVLPTQCICVFCVVLRTNIISLYSINWMVFYNREGGVFTVRYGLNLRVMCINPSKPSGHCMYRQLTFNSSTFWPHSVFMCSVWNWEQTAIISLYSIDW